MIEVAINSNARGPSLARMIDMTKCKILITSGKHLQQLSEVSESLKHLQQVIMIDEQQRAKELPSKF